MEFIHNFLQAPSAQDFLGQSIEPLARIRIHGGADVLFRYLLGIDQNGGGCFILVGQPCDHNCKYQQADKPANQCLCPIPFQNLPVFKIFSERLLETACVHKYLSSWCDGRDYLPKGLRKSTENDIQTRSAEVLPFVPTAICPSLAQPPLNV